jgi:hypothetical protein
MKNLRKKKALSLHLKRRDENRKAKKKPKVGNTATKSNNSKKNNIKTRTRVQWPCISGSRGVFACLLADLFVLPEDHAG